MINMELATMFPAYLQHYRQHYPEVTPHQLLQHIGYFCPDKQRWFLNPDRFPSSSYSPGSTSTHQEAYQHQQEACINQHQEEYLDEEEIVDDIEEEEEEEEIDDPEEDLYYPGPAVCDVMADEDRIEAMDLGSGAKSETSGGGEGSSKSNDVTMTSSSAAGDANNGLPLTNACEDHWSWNTKERSHEIRLNGPKHRIAHFHPNWSNGTAGIRGTRVLNKGRYYWEVNVSQRIFGTSMMLGIGTKKSRLHVDAFINMLGEDDQSWGLSHKGLLWHNGLHRQYTKAFRENVATTIGLYFDGIAGTLTYFKDGVSLGVAFTGLEKVTSPLYPMICSTAAKTEMSLGLMKREFTSLQDRCRAVTLRQLTHEEQIDQLPLPKSLKVFVAEGLSEDCQEDIVLVQNNVH